MTSQYIFQISQTANRLCDARRLQLELQAYGLPVAAITLKSEVIYVDTLSEWSAAQQTTAAAVVAAHGGQPVPSVKNHMAVLVIGGPYVATNDSGYDVVSYVVSKPDFFATNLANVFGQILGRVKVVGSGASLRIVETQVNGTATVIIESPCADTGGLWVVKNIVSSAGLMNIGYNEYSLEVTRGGASEFALRGFTVALIEYM